MKFIDNIIFALIKRRIKAYIKRMKKMAEQESKPWYLSRGVIGGLVAMVIGIVGAFGFGAGLVGEQAAIVDTVLQIATAGAGALAVWGRIRAKKKIVK